MCHRLDVNANFTYIYLDIDVGLTVHPFWLKWQNNEQEKKKTFNQFPPPVAKRPLNVEVNGNAIRLTWILLSSTWTSAEDYRNKRAG